MRLARLVFPIAIFVMVASCGARTELRDSNLVDASTDVSLPTDSQPPEDVVTSDVEIGNDGAVCCEDGQNLDSPPDALSGGASVAWQYIPSCNITVISIELHNVGGQIVIRDSNGDEPGVALFTGTLPAADGNNLAWTMTNIDPPLPLTMGHVYWIQEAAGPLSESSNGVEYTYYADTGQGWDGPYNWHAYTSRIHGECKK